MTAELWIGIGVTIVILYVMWVQYKDDYNDFFKF